MSNRLLNGKALLGGVPGLEGGRSRQSVLGVAFICLLRGMVRLDEWGFG